MTQMETARTLGTTRANVSMIELRARRKIAQAKETLDAFRSTLTDHMLVVPKGSRFYDIPPLVLGEGDKWGTHIQSNIVEIVRMVKDLKPPCLKNGKTSRNITFVFNRAGKLRIERPG